MNLESCDNCTKRGICKWYMENPAGASIGPGWDYRMELDDFIKATLPKHCRNFEKETLYENRLPSGVLYNREPLRLWYPDQEPEQFYNNDFWHQYREPECECNCLSPERLGPYGDRGY